MGLEREGLGLLKNEIESHNCCSGYGDVPQVFPKSDAPPAPKISSFSKESVFQNFGEFETGENCSGEVGVNVEWGKREKNESKGNGRKERKTESKKKERKRKKK